MKNSLFALTPALEECRTPGEIAEVSRRFVRPMGLDYVACLKLPPGGEEVEGGQAAIEVHFSTFPGEWFSRGTTGEFLDHDPILAEARTAGKSFTWREAWSRWQGPGALARAALARGLGLADGIVIPMVRSSFAVPVVLAAGKSPGFDISHEECADPREFRDLSARGRARRDPGSARVRALPSESGNASVGRRRANPIGRSAKSSRSVPRRSIITSRTRSENPASRRASRPSSRLCVAVTSPEWRSRAVRNRRIPACHDTTRRCI